MFGGTKCIVGWCGSSEYPLNSTKESENLDFCTSWSNKFYIRLPRGFLKNNDQLVAWGQYFKSKIYCTFSSF